MSLYEKIFKRGYRRQPANIALQCDNEVYTYEELELKVMKLAKQFQRVGIGKNSKVVLKMNNPLRFSFALLSLLYLEAIPMPIYHGMGYEKFNHVCEVYGVNFVVLDMEAPNLGQKYQNVLQLSDYGAVYTFEKEIDISLAEIGLILFTSGTTSMPKAIMLTYENICSNVKSISEYLKLTLEDRILLIKDLSHSSSIIGELFVGLYNGCSIKMTTKLLRAVTILSLMSEQKTTIFFGVPTLLKEIMTCKKRQEYDISTLRIINFYGASMNQRDILNIIEMFSETNIIYSYGQTEASPRVTFIEKEMLVKHPASSGKTIRDVSVTIVDSLGNECKAYEKGEIVVKGPNVMKGYYRDKEKTRKVIRDNKLYTGDLGYLDEDGFLYVVGRMDNMFTRGGKNIYPEEIEGVLISHPDVLEALVEPRNNTNEVVEIIAYVVLKDTVSSDVNNIWSYCKKKLEDYKVPKELNIVSSLKKTPSGKIKRKQFI